MLSCCCWKKCQSSRAINNASTIFLKGSAAAHSPRRCCLGISFGPDGVFIAGGSSLPPAKGKGCTRVCVCVCLCLCWHFAPLLSLESCPKWPPLLSWVLCQPQRAEGKSLLWGKALQWGLREPFPTSTGVFLCPGQGDVAPSSSSAPQHLPPSQPAAAAFPRRSWADFLSR